jgi:two-component system chemotaxis response regulator CheY
MTVPILIVDDSPVMRAMLRKAIELSGQPAEQIFEASDGLDALDWLSQGSASIVFTDLHMPRVTGFELIEKMSQDPKLKSLPVVVVSSDVGTQHREQLRALGVRLVLRKPFRPEQIRAVIRSLSQPHTGKEAP